MLELQKDWGPMPIQQTAHETRTEQRVRSTSFPNTISSDKTISYIKELADRLNSLESQIQHPQSTVQNFDFGTMGEQNFIDAQSPPQFKRQRTHSMTEGFHEAFGRPSWSGQDRGNSSSFGQDGYSMLTGQEPSMNGHHRNSFSELSLIGNLITGSNEGSLKA